MNITESDIVVQRLNNQRLTSAAFRKPVDVAHWFGAVQAQDFVGAKWALAQRMRATTDNQIEEAYNEGTILRTHLMRPTWHFVAADDIRWMLELTAPRVNAACASNYRKLELDSKVFSRCNRAFANALRDGRHMTRTALRDVINRAGVAADDSVRMGHILLRAELDGVVCSGRKMGSQLTYALLDERAVKTKSITREEALAILTKRYFASHGPATLQDFIWWSGLTSADAKNGVALVQRSLRNSVSGDKVYWMPRSSLNGQTSTSSAYLLPAFDEYFVAYKDRRALVNADDAHHFISNGGGLGPAIIIDGKVVGGWKRTKDGTSARISLSPFKNLTRREKTAINDAAERYATFLGKDAEVSFEL